MSVTSCRSFKNLYPHLVSLPQWYWKLVWNWSLHYQGSFRNCVEQSSPLFHTGHVEFEQHFVFNILVLFGIVCFNKIPYPPLSDRDQLYDFGRLWRLVIFPISRELQCQSWDMPSHLEHPNITKKEALCFYLFYG